jgi:hypothetical protein
MKLKDLFLSEVTYGTQKIPAVKDLPPIDPVVLSDTIQKVKQSKEYKDILSLATDITTPTKLKNGSLTFSTKTGDAVYVIYSNGQLRIQAANADRMQKLASPLPDYDDLFIRYKDCLIALKEKILKRQNSANNTHAIFTGDIGKDLSQLEFLPSLKNLTIENSSIESLHGCPENIDYLIIKNNKNLSSLEGITPNIGKRLQLLGNKKITSLQGIDKFIKYIGELFIFDDNIESHVLGILKIKGLSDGVFKEAIDSHVGYRMNKVNQSTLSKILNDHMKSRSILACQQALMKSHLLEFAQL